VQFIARFILDFTRIIKKLDKTDEIYITMKILNTLGVRFTQTAINYFVYQAKQVQIKIQAQSLEDYHKKTARNHGLFLWLFINFIIFEIISLTYYIFDKTGNLGILAKET
jgi:hypothetical protein